MPKPILINKDKQSQRLGSETISTARTKVEPVLLEKRLRQKRSSEYMEAIKNLDIGGHDLNKEQFEAFVNAIRNEFPDVPFENQLVGIVAQCYLGKPYEVHTLDLTGNIVIHYKASDSMPPLLERARSLALHGGYVFVEVYVDSLRGVNVEGNVSVSSLGTGGYF